MTAVDVAAVIVSETSSSATTSPYRLDRDTADNVGAA
jgi:hypothetical protein